MSSGGRSTQKVTNDGSDFSNRERVAQQYKISSEHKKIIQPYLFLSAFLIVVSSTYASLWHHELKPEGWTFPPWSILWILGMAPTGLGINALKRNDPMNMRMCISGTCLFILGGIFWGMYENIHDMLHLVKEGTPHDQMKIVYNVPSVLILFGAFMISLFVHLKVIYHAKILCRAWKVHKAK